MHTNTVDALASQVQVPDAQINLNYQDPCSMRT